MKMKLRSGKRYQPYSQQCFSHHHKNMQLRSGQMYQFCLPRLFLRGYRFKKMGTRRASIRHLEKMMNDAVKANAVSMVRLLIDEYGLDVNVKLPQFAEVARFRSIWTVLHTACSHGHDEMVRLLVNQFGALEGKCRFYVEILILLAVENAHVDVWGVLEKASCEVVF